MMMIDNITQEYMQIMSKQIKAREVIAMNDSQGNKLHSLTTMLSKRISCQISTIALLLLPTNAVSLNLDSQTVLSANPLHIFDPFQLIRKGEVTSDVPSALNNHFIYGKGLDK